MPLLSRLPLLAPLLLFGMLSLSRQRQADRQQEAGHGADPVLKPASHNFFFLPDVLYCPLITIHRSLLRRFLIRIDIGLYLQIVE
jgi:hypothetical protein